MYVFVKQFSRWHSKYLFYFVLGDRGECLMSQNFVWWWRWGEGRCIGYTYRRETALRWCFVVCRLDGIVAGEVFWKGYQLSDERHLSIHQWDRIFPISWFPRLISESEEQQQCCTDILNISVLQNLEVEAIGAWPMQPSSSRHTYFPSSKSFEFWFSRHLNHVIVTHISLVLHVMDPPVPTRLESSPFDDCQVMDIRSFFEGKPPTSSQGSSSQKGGSKTPNKKTTTPQKNSKKRKSRVIGNDAFYWN